MKIEPTMLSNIVQDNELTDIYRYRNGGGGGGANETRSLYLAGTPMLIELRIRFKHGKIQIQPGKKKTVSDPWEKT